jgi:starch phosphorylase
VEPYAEPLDGGGTPVRTAMAPSAKLTVHGYLYSARVPATRPATDYTPRIIPYHSEVSVPLEVSPILWLC